MPCFDLTWIGCAITSKRPRFFSSASFPAERRASLSISEREAFFLGALGVEGEQARQIIVSDPAIIGGMPTIRSTPITVQPILGRLESGDGVECVLEDYPYLYRDAMEAAALCAKANPLRGRPGSKLWRGAFLIAFLCPRDGTAGAIEVVARLKGHQASVEMHDGETVIHSDRPE